MLDSALRPVKDRLLAPLARGPMRDVPPAILSVAALCGSVGAAVAAWQRVPWLAVVLWLAGRVLDGLDGVVARAAGRASETGGVIDFALDTIGYAAVPLGLAFGVDDRTTWVATALLLASFYFNAVSLGLAASLQERRRTTSGARDTTDTTSVPLPRGLVEGTETILLFAVALALDDRAHVVWWFMAGAVTLGALERLRWTVGDTGPGAGPRTGDRR